MLLISVVRELGRSINLSDELLHQLVSSLILILTTAETYSQRTLTTKFEKSFLVRHHVGLIAFGYIKYIRT